MSLTISSANEQFLFKKAPVLEFCTGLHIESPTENAFREANPALAEKMDSPPVNLTCVIDRSGSMRGRPLGLVKKTIEFIIDHLRETDSLAIVDFGSDSRLAAKMTLLKTEEDRKGLKELVEEIECDGFTNMSGGLSTGILQNISSETNGDARLKILSLFDNYRVYSSASNFWHYAAGIYSNITDFFSNSKVSQECENDKRKKQLSNIDEKDIKIKEEKSNPQHIHSIFLLTDGNANVGICNSHELTVTAQRAMRLLNRIKKCSLFCFGAGSDHNEGLMKDLAEIGNGMYYFIEKIESIPEAFAGALGGIMSILAQEIEITIEAVKNEKFGVEIEEIVTGYKLTETIPKKQFKIKIPDLYFEEKRDFLIKLKVKSLNGKIIQNESLEFLKISANFHNMILKKQEKQDFFSKIAFSNEENFDEKNIENLDPTVMEQKNRIIAQKAMEEAMEAQSAQDAEKALSSAMSCFVFSSKFSSAQQLAAKQMNDMVENLKNGIQKGGEDEFQQVGKKKIASQTAAVKKQRFAAGMDEEFELYLNSRQKVMMSSAKSCK